MTEAPSYAPTTETYAPTLVPTASAAPTIQPTPYNQSRSTIN